MHVYRICNSTHYINAHHTIVYTYLILYCKDIHQPLSTITHDEWDVSIPGIIDPLCIGRCVFGTSLFTPARFHGGGSARKSCLFFPWVHAILHMVTPANHHSVSRWGWGWNCGELLSKSSLHRPSPNHFMTFVIRSCSWPHCACCCGCCWCCCCSRCRCCYCRCFCFCCFDWADSVETWMLCTLGAFGLTRIPGALYLTLFC